DRISCVVFGYGVCQWHCLFVCFFYFQAEDGIRDLYVTGVQTCALPISCSAVARDVETAEQVVVEPAVEVLGRTGGVQGETQRSRSEERRVGKEGRSRGGMANGKKKEKRRRE